MSSTTNIETLKFIEDESLEVLDENNLSKSIVDLSLSLSTRIKAIDLYYQKEGRDNTIETINKLGMMYELSGVKSLKNYLFAICEQSQIEPFLKSISAQALWMNNKEDEMAYQALDLVYPQLDDKVGTPYRIEIVKMLMNNEKYKDKTLSYFIGIIDDLKIDCKYRYKAIIGLEEKFLYFTISSLLVFLQNKGNVISLRILAGQYLLQKDEKNKDNVENILLNISKDETVEYNVRADASDVLLNLGSDDIKKQAEQIIRHLGIGRKTVYTVYDNAQNVHTKEVEKGIEETLEYLQGFDLMEMKEDFKKITFEYVYDQIMNMVNDSNRSNIELALSRIQLDRALYSRYNCTLSYILLKIWTFICGHENEQTLKQRLLEELNEMSGTCSSGYASRLINTISGFGNFGIRISWRDQIVSNFTARLNTRIKAMDNLRKAERIVVEMTLETSDYRARKNFLKFLRENLSDVREELYKEFKQYLRDDDFELYFRSAVAMYESGTYI